MKQYLALLGLLTILWAPYVEYSHDHWLGQGHDDCPACQLDKCQADKASSTAHTDVVFAFGPTRSANQSTAITLADPLRRAPKTSPPRCRS